VRDLNFYCSVGDYKEINFGCRIIRERCFVGITFWTIKLGVAY